VFTLFSGVLLKPLKARLFAVLRLIPGLTPRLKPVAWR
jgi:hypothetical protein